MTPILHETRVARASLPRRVSRTSRRGRCALMVAPCQLASITTMNPTPPTSSRKDAPPLLLSISPNAVPTNRLAEASIALIMSANQPLIRLAEAIIPPICTEYTAPTLPRTPSSVTDWIIVCVSVMKPAWVAPMMPAANSAVGIFTDMASTAGASPLRTPRLRNSLPLSDSAGDPGEQDYRDHRTRADRHHKQAESGVLGVEPRVRQHRQQRLERHGESAVEERHDNHGAQDGLAIDVLQPFQQVFRKLWRLSMLPVEYVLILKA